MEGVERRIWEEVLTEPSRRSGYLSWEGEISGKPLLIAYIDARTHKKLHPSGEYIDRQHYLRNGLCRSAEGAEWAQRMEKQTQPPLRFYREAVSP